MATFETPEFEKHARLLDDLSVSASACFNYEWMSGALIWDDELPILPASEMGWFRMVLAYRTSVILGRPRMEFAPLWDAVKRIAPRWPGFRAERCSENATLAECVLTQQKRATRTIDRVDSAVSGRWRPMAGQNPVANRVAGGN